ncbi:MAG: hypothetical protein IPJ41_16565 [Phycisphaerales bacterium]|nr:hypothetical protein [Phycisphaerales bacterium]
MHLRTTMLLASLAAAPALAQDSNISPTNKWSWGENLGWMNWHDAGSPAGSQGVRIQDTFLSGFVWAENVGWINLGDGTPGLGSSYGNTSGSDAGVNIGQGGILSGLAWGENVGWINFDTAPTLQQYGQHARFDFGSGRFRGYAWGENVGWINLDDDEHFVAQLCPSDWNGDGVVNTQDFIAYLNDWAPKHARADVNGDGTVNTQDFILFLNMWASGC